MKALDRCAVCDLPRWFHWLTRSPFAEESSVQTFLRAVRRLEARQ